jgi:glycosyltransferase involved in cell wall biosynthesis
MQKKTIILSGINLFEGGPLSIIRDCLAFINQSQYVNQYHFIALVHQKKLFPENDFSNIEFIEFPKSRKSYFYRLYYEYVHFKKLAKEKNVFFWISLHDISPRIGNINQAVYCHNPSPFNTINLSDIFIQPIQFFFRLFYKYLYQININKNKFIIVQQLWIKNWFSKTFHFNKNLIIISKPETPILNVSLLNTLVIKNNTEKIFFYPTFPRPFKNIEVICEAMKILSKKEKNNITTIITIDGSENKYAKSIVEKYKHIKNIKFIGLIKREKVYEHYAQCDGLIFPSKLETWGLPISEFKQFEKPIFASNLPYAKETMSDYKKAIFFNPDDANQLSELLINSLKNELVFDETQNIDYEHPIANNWSELFAIILK